DTALALEAQIDPWSALVVPLADRLRTMSLMHCSSSTAGTSVSPYPNAGWLPRPFHWSGLSLDGEVFLLTSPFIDRYVGQVNSCPGGFNLRFRGFTSTEVAISKR